MANKTASLTLKLIDQLSGPSKKAADSLKRVGQSSKALDDAKKRAADFAKAVDKFGNAKDGFRKAADGMKLAQERVKALAREMQAAGAPSAKLAADYKRAQDAASRASATFSRQRDVFRQTKSAVEGFGASIGRIAAAEQRMQSAVERANRSLERQQQVFQRREASARSYEQNLARRAAVAQERRHIVGGMASAAGVYGAYKAKSFAGNAINRYAEYDYAVLRQQAYVDISEEEQAKILLPQARKIATDTKFSNQDIVDAQTEVARRLPPQLQNGGVIAPIIDNVKNYALATKGVDMNMSAEAVTGYLMSAGRDISTAQKASSEALRATNMLIRMQKIGGMGHEDLQHFVNRGISSGRIAGLSEATMGAFAVGLRRNNISGDQAGTAMRTIASKLVAPTDKGRAALATAGINYDDYTTMPGGLSVGALEGKFKQDFGKGFTPAIRAELADILSDEDVIGNRGAFTTAVSDALTGIFEKTKKGKMKPADRAKLAKKLGEFHKFSTESVDADRLLMDIIKADPTLAALNAFGTDKHGNKLGLIGKAFEQFIRDRATLSSVPADYGQKIADKITSGFGGALERLKGSVENLSIQMAAANKGWLTPTMDKMGNSIDAIANLPESVRRILTAGAGAGAVVGGVAGVAGLIKLSAAGPALLQSAAALNGAAGRLAAGGGVGAGPGGKAAAGAGIGVAGLVGAGSAAAAGSAIAVEVEQYLEKQFPWLAKVNRAIPTPDQLGQQAGGWIGRKIGLLPEPPPPDRVSGVWDAEKGRQGWAAAQTQANIQGIEAGSKFVAGVSQAFGTAGDTVAAQAVAIHDRVQAVFANPINVKFNVGSLPTPSAWPSATPAAGTRANGGPVSSSGVYKVGERGPELFAPGVGGRVYSGGGGGGGGGGTTTNTFNVTVNATTNASAREIADQVTRELGTQMRRTRDRTFADVV